MIYIQYVSIINGRLIQQDLELYMTMIYKMNLVGDNNNDV